MIHRSVQGRGGRWWAQRSILVCCGLLLALAVELSATTGGKPDYAAYIRAAGGVRSATSTATGVTATATAIPAFARKYGLRCSACHTAWPELNVFGQKFKDAGYQLGNDRDSPIWTSPTYWPIAVRTTPQWHFESTTNQPVDDGLGGTVEKTVTQSGFDISGADLLMMGTLYKNITFGFVPTLENGEGVGIEAAFVRFDNLFKSGWVNLKMGKFELDNLLSEKRIVTLSNNGGFYQSYHFVPVNDATNFGLGDNQIGAEWMGHSKNSYSRISFAVLDGTDGDPGIGSGQSYDGMITASQAFDAGKLGIERIGLYAYVGQRPTLYETTGGGTDIVAGSGTDNKSFYRVGVVGDFFLGNNLEFIPFYLYGSDNAYLATGTPGDQPLPAGAQDSKWNGFLLETHYYVNPQLMLINRLDFIRMTQQADPATEKTLGNSDAYTFGLRWYPMMISRAGLAIHWEVAYTKTTGTVPMSGDGVGLPPLTPTTQVGSTSALFALDFAF
jgi:hypothetical protein